MKQLASKASSWFHIWANHVEHKTSFGFLGWKVLVKQNSLAFWSQAWNQWATKILWSQTKNLCGVFDQSALMMEPRNSSCATYMEIANSKLRIYTLPGWSRCQKIPRNAQNNTKCNALEMLSPYFCASSQHDLLKREISNGYLLLCWLKMNVISNQIMMTWPNCMTLLQEASSKRVCQNRMSKWEYLSGISLSIFCALSRIVSWNENLSLHFW